jgi:TRAP-type uncharacterized transport system substrate-binding protein
MYCAGVPYPAIGKLSKTRKLKLITPTEPEIMAKVKESGLVPSVIPGGSYSFVPEDVPTVSAVFLVVCLKQLDEKLAYYTTKAIWEQREMLKKSYRGYKAGISRKKTGSFVKMFEPFLHPGARRYWTEQGMLK